MILREGGGVHERLAKICGNRDVGGDLGLSGGDQHPLFSNAGICSHRLCPPAAKGPYLCALGGLPSDMGCQHFRQVDGRVVVKECR